jgi:hypothetical protein
MKLFCIHCGFANETVGSVRPTTCSKCKKPLNKISESKKVAAPSIYEQLQNKQTPKQEYNPKPIFTISDEEQEDLESLQDLDIDGLNLISVEVDNRFKANSFSFGEVAGSAPNEEVLKPKKGKRINSKVMLKQVMDAAKQGTGATEV